MLRIVYKQINSVKFKFREFGTTVSAVSFSLLTSNLAKATSQILPTRLQLKSSFARHCLFGIDFGLTSHLASLRMYRTLATSIVFDEKPSNDEATQRFEADQEKFIRSQSDNFNYKLIQLHNRIRILLISDPTYHKLEVDGKVGLVSESTDSDGEHMQNSESEQDSDFDDDNESLSSNRSTLTKNGLEKSTALVVAVNAGSFKDPVDFPGLAHMLEHLMSMGSEEYPSENALDDFLSARGGYQNAHTECEHTVYEVKVHRKYLKEAINMLASAFSSPLLRQESIDREIHAVEAEFVEACTSDEDRMQLLLSHLADSRHPLSKFGWGNRKSLITDPISKGLNIHKELVAFFRAHYQPQSIVVVVQSQESLENLEAWTANAFCGIPFLVSKETPTQLFSDISPFDTRFHRFYRMETVDSGVRLHVHWCLPPQLEKYCSSTIDYLSSLIGHEGRGSLIAQLRKRLLAIDLFTDSEDYCFKNNRLCAIFGIGIYLTELGAEKLDEVVALLFEYLAAIRKAGALEYFFNELQTISRISFDHKSEEKSLEYSISLATNMLYMPVKHILSGNQLYYEFDKNAVDDLMVLLVAENANFILMDNKLVENLETHCEPWMGTRYQDTAIPTAWLDSPAHINSELFHYPPPNAFIATKFDLLRDVLSLDAPERQLTDDYPIKIVDSPRLTAWYKADFNFNLPKASIVVHLLNRCLFDTSEHMALSDVMFEYIMLLLKEECYDALAAGLSWSLDRSDNGLLIYVSGFDHKLPELIMLILKRIDQFEFDASLLKSIKQEVKKNYNNDYLNPETLCLHLRLSAITEPFHTFIERCQHIDSISIEKLFNFKQLLLSSLSFELLIEGNLKIAAAIDLCRRIEHMYKIISDCGETKPYKRVKNQVTQLPNGTQCVRALTLSRKSPISHIVCYYQLMPLDFRSHSYLLLLIEIIDELCFNTLRTQEGLGYNVGCMTHNTFDILGFSVYLTSCADKFNCTFVEDRIKHFVESVCREHVMHKLTQDKFDKFVSSIIKRKEAPYLSLQERVRRHLEEIVSFDYCFTRDSREIAQLKQATLESFKEWTLQYIFLPRNQCKSLVVQVVGNGSIALEECLTFSDNSVCESMISEGNEAQISLQLIQSNIQNSDKYFVSNINCFKKQLPIFVPQVSDQDHQKDPVSHK